jgi:lipopolysaccharide export system permease protein
VRIVSRHLLVQFALATIAVFAGIVTIWLTADTLLSIDELAAQPEAVLWKLAVHGLELVPLAVPVAAVVGAVFSFTRAVRHREITAIRCGGVPLRSALLPISIACALFGAALVWVEDRVLVPSRERATAARVIAETGGLGHPSRANGRFWYATGDSVFAAESFLPERFALQGVSIFELDPARGIRRRIDAAEARHLEGSSWEILDARVVDFTGQGIAVKRMPTLRADLGIGKSELLRSVPPLEALSLRRLARAHARETDAQRRASYSVAFHARIAQPMSMLVLVLFALYFATGDSERGDSLARTLLRALGVTAAFWVCFTLALIVGRSAVVPPPLPVWLVTAAFLALGVQRFRAIEE